VPALDELLLERASVDRLEESEAKLPMDVVERPDDGPRERFFDQDDLPSLHSVKVMLLA
jgi:hypothetical protein